MAPSDCRGYRRVDCAMPVRSAIALRRPIVHCAPVGLLLLLARLLDIGGVVGRFPVLVPAANRKRGTEAPRD